MESAPNVREGRTASSRGEFVQSLERGLAVVRSFGPGRTQLTLTDVAEATGLTRAAARRFLLTLVEIGYVRNDGRKFSLRPRVLELGWSYLSGLSLADIARPFMDDIVNSIQESTSIAVLDDDEIVYVAHIAPIRAMTINAPIGGRDPAYCTALGRVLLASLPDEEIDALINKSSLIARTDATVTEPEALRKVLLQVRENGYALVDHEFEDGLVALAVPVHDANGSVIAALNVATYSLRTGPEALRERHLPVLQSHVRMIEAEMRSAPLSNTASS